MTNGKISLEEAALGCRAGGFTPQQGAPCFYLAYSETDALDMAAVMVKVWAGEISMTTLENALKACLTKDNERAYSDQDILQVRMIAMSLNWVDSARYEQNIYFKAIGLYQGDLTSMKLFEKVDFLVVSALPGNYSPIGGSVIGALNNKGVSVAALAQNKAANYEPELPCWISQIISNPQPGIAFDRILVFEPQDPRMQAAEHVKDIFEAIRRFMESNTSAVTVAMPLVSTGSSGADPSSIMTASFNSAKQLMLTPFNLYAVKIVIYNQNQLNQIIPVFTQLKNN